MFCDNDTKCLANARYQSFYSSFAGTWAGAAAVEDDDVLDRRIASSLNAALVAHGPRASDVIQRYRATASGLLASMEEAADNGWVVLSSLQVDNM